MVEKIVIEPLVSIIMPCYKVGKLVKRSIDSIRNQTYSNIEIIAVNDCSPDDTLEVLQGICETMGEGCLLKVISLAVNSGSGVARDEGLKAAKGKYIMFVDSDDWILKDTVATCVGLMEKYKVELVEFGYTRVRNNKDDLPETIDSAVHLENMEFVTSNTEIERRSDHLMWNKIYRHDIIRDNNLKFIHRLHQDTLFTRKYALLCKNAIFIKNKFYRYFYNTESVTSVKSQKRFENNLRDDEVIKLYLQYGLHDRVEEALAISLNLLLRKLISLSRLPHEDFKFVNPDGILAQRSEKFINLYNKSGLLFRLRSYMHLGLRSSFKLILRHGF